MVFNAASRFGFAWKCLIDIDVGVIDTDFCGKVGVILFHHFDLDFEVKVGDRIVQLIIEKSLTQVLEMEDLDSTFRGVGGFGSKEV